MDESLWTLMTIVGPLILLLLLVWLVMRSRRQANQTTDTTARTEQATHEGYVEEEVRRREGTDDL
jgi:membrane protein implicated in regulation of membrane protease activity